MYSLEADVVRQKAIAKAASSDYTGLLLLLFNVPFFVLTTLTAIVLWYGLHQMSVQLCTALGFGH
jgi:hypothetical protein